MGDAWWHMIGFRRVGRRERSRGGRRFPLFIHTKACSSVNNPVCLCENWPQGQQFMILHDSEHCSECACVCECICTESVLVCYVCGCNTSLGCVLEVVSLLGEPSRLITTSGRNYSSFKLVRQREDGRKTIIL